MLLLSNPINQHLWQREPVLQRLCDQNFEFFGVRHLIADQPLHLFGHFDRDLGRHADELVLALLEQGEVVVYDDRAPKPVLGRIASVSVPERTVHDVHRAGVHLDHDRLGVLVDGPGRAETPRHHARCAVLLHERIESRQRGGHQRHVRAGYREVSVILMQKLRLVSGSGPRGHHAGDLDVGSQNGTDDVSPTWVHRQRVHGAGLLQQIVRVVRLLPLGEGNSSH